MGVCCIVFDIDGMLFECFMNFLNIEQNKIKIYIFSIFQVFFALHAISNIKKKNWCTKKKFRGGGGGVDFFFRKTILSHFTFYAIFNIKKKIEKCPFTYWLNGMCFSPNSREGQLESIDIHLYILYSLVLILYLKCGGGGGCNVFLTFYAISNISRKKNLGIQNNYFSFNVFFVFFLYAGNIVKCPFTYSYWLNGRWFLQIVERDSWNLYPLYPLFPGSDFVSQMWGWFGGGGVMFFSHFMLFPTFLEKQIWEYITIISHLM